MEKYKSYVKEKYNREILETANGFIEYEHFADGSVYIYTLFVTKEGRSKGTGNALEQLVIEKHNPHILFCDIDKESSNWILALIQICKKADYRFYSDSEDRVVLFKEL